LLFYTSVLAGNTGNWDLSHAISLNLGLKR